MTKPAHDKTQSDLWKRQINRDTQGYAGPHWKVLAKENRDAR